MRRLEDGFLDEVGLGSIPEELQRQVLEAFRFRHQCAVGDEIYRRLDPQQRAEADRLVEADDGNELRRLVFRAGINLRDVIYATFLLLMIELRAAAPAILESAKNGLLPAEYAP